MPFTRTDRDTFIEELTHSFSCTVAVLTKAAKKQADKKQKAETAGRMSVWISTEPTTLAGGDKSNGQAYPFRIQPPLKDVHRSDFIPGAFINVSTNEATFGEITVPAATTAFLPEEDAADATLESIYERLRHYLGPLGRTGLDIFWEVPEE